MRKPYLLSLEGQVQMCCKCSMPSVRVSVSHVLCLRHSLVLCWVQDAITTADVPTKSQSAAGRVG